MRKGENIIRKSGDHTLWTRLSDPNHYRVKCDPTCIWLTTKMKVFIIELLVSNKWAVRFAKLTYPYEILQLEKNTIINGGTLHPNT